MTADRVLQLLLVLTFLSVLGASLSLPVTAAVAPAIAAGLGLALTLFVALREPPRQSETPPDWPQLAGFAGLLAAVGLLGLVQGGAVAVLALLRGQAGFGLRTALAVSAGWAILAETVFNRLLDGQLYRGVLGLL